MPSTVNPEPRAGSDGSGRRSSPASCAARSRCAMASDSVASARSLSAAVTRSSGQMPPMSAMAVASATIRLARRIAAAIRSRRVEGAIAASSAIAAATTASGPEATSARRLAASRTARSARNGLLPPRASSSAATSGRAASRASARPSPAKRSARRCAAPVSCGFGQLAGRWKIVSVIPRKAGREASLRSSGDRLCDGTALAGHAGDHAGGAGQRRRRGARLAAVAGAGRSGVVHQSAGGCGKRQWRADAAGDRHRRAGLGGLPHGGRSAARSAADRRHGDRPGWRTAHEHPARRCHRCRSTNCCSGASCRGRSRWMRHS